MRYPCGVLRWGVFGCLAVGCGGAPVAPAPAAPLLRPLVSKATALESDAGDPVPPTSSTPAASSHHAAQQETALSMVCASARIAVNPMRPLGGEHSVLMGRGFYQLSAEATAYPPRGERGVPLALTVHGPAVVDIHEALRLQLMFHNRSTEPSLVMRAMDGSFSGRRFPTYDLYARRHADGTVHRYTTNHGQPSIHCGNLNPTTAEDFVWLEPGESRDDVAGAYAAHLQHASFEVPGRYSIWVVYTFCGHELDSVPLGVSVKRPGVHRGAFASNELVITVKSVQSRQSWPGRGSILVPR